MTQRSRRAKPMDCPGPVHGAAHGLPASRGISAVGERRLSAGQYLRRQPTCLRQALPHMGRVRDPVRPGPRVVRPAPPRSVWTWPVFVLELGLGPAAALGVWPATRILGYFTVLLLTIEAGSAAGRGRGRRPGLASLAGRAGLTAGRAGLMAGPSDPGGPCGPGWAYRPPAQSSARRRANCRRRLRQPDRGYRRCRGPRDQHWDQHGVEAHWGELATDCRRCR